jgi:ferritin-like metal-binding protein YciE
MARRELFITWLHDAHAFESMLVSSLEGQVKLAADHPQVQQGIEQHLEATKRHKEIVEEILEELGESSSGMKDTMARVGGMMQGLMQGASGDTLVKAALQDYSAEHMEIASYQALIVAANELGHGNLASRFEIILQDEMRMAEWLSSQLPMIVRAELNNEGDANQAGATE